MKLQRDWVTPITMGAFGLLAVTGVLMFFHADTGLNKVVHEWLSWLLVAGVALHAAVNWAGVKRHLAGTKARIALGLAAAVLALSFLPIGGSRQPPFVAPVRVLAQAPVPVLAQVAGTTPEALRGRLQQQGFVTVSDTDTAATLAGADLGAQARLLGAVLAPSAAR